MKKCDEIRHKETDQTVEERVAIYMLLSRLFTDQSTGADLINYLELLTPHKGEFSGLTASFRAKLIEWQEKDQLDHLLKTEYARIFILAGGVRPYESVTRGEAKMLMQEPWVEVKKFYQKRGLKLDNPGLHPEDHVSVEFAFMLYLFEKDNYASAADFFQQHIYLWIPQMLDEIIKYPYADFYKDVARFGQSFIENEQHQFSKSNAEALSMPDQIQGSDS